MHSGLGEVFQGNRMVGLGRTRRSREGGNLAGSEPRFLFSQE